MALVFDLISKTPQAKGRTAAHQALFLNTQALPQTGGRRIGQRRIEPRLLLIRRTTGLTQFSIIKAAQRQCASSLRCGYPAPIHEGPLAQRRCFFLGCWLRGDSGSGASAPRAEGSGSGKSPAGWSSKRVRMGRPPGCPPGARHHPRPGVARVSPRYCYGIAKVVLPC